MQTSIGLFRVTGFQPTSWLYFTLRGNRVQHFDLQPFFLELAERPPGKEPQPVLYEAAKLKIRFFPVTNQVYCLEFTPKATGGETWLEAQQPGSAWRTALDRYNAESFFYFFWVADDSFELFRSLRAQLWKNNHEVGWKPVTRKSPMEVCNGFEGSAAFQPQ